MWERESAQYNGIDYGELRGHSADAESEHEHGKKTERPIFKQNTKTDADVLPERIKHDRYSFLAFSSLLSAFSLLRFFFFPSTSPLQAMCQLFYQPHKRLLVGQLRSKRSIGFSRQTSVFGNRP